MRIHETESMSTKLELIPKTQQVLDCIEECLQLSAHLRGDLFGEGEAIDQELPQTPATLDGLLHDLMAKACKLRAELERTKHGINPPPLKAESKLVRGGLNG